MATLIVHYIQIHSQGHFGSQSELGGEKKKGKIEELQKNLRQSETSTNNLLVSTRLRVCGSADRPWSQKVRDRSSE